MAFAIYTLSQKKCPAYGAVALGLAVFIGLYLLDALALNRIGMEGAWKTGIDLDAEWHRLLNGGEENRMLMLFNVAAFVPFGIALAVFLETMGMEKWRSLGRVALVASGLTLCVECIQLVFRVGFFEVTDLVLNCAGAGMGGMIVIGIRSVFTKYVR